MEKPVPISPVPPGPLASARIRCTNCGYMTQLDEAYLQDLVAPLRERWQEEVRQQECARRNELEEVLRERDGKIKELQSQEVQLRRKRRELEDEKEALEHRMERMRDEIREQLRPAEEARAKKNAEAELLQMQSDHKELVHRLTDEHEVKERQLLEQLKRVKSEAEELRRKADSAARQEEGFAAEGLLGDGLHRHFPDDQIIPVRRGNRGPDFSHVVRSGNLTCGKILWDRKRTVKWSDDWPRKLAAEVRAAGATFGVIVSDTLPPGGEGSTQIGEIWVTDPGHVWDLAAVLREAVIMVARYEAANNARTDIAGKVYDYITTGGFEARYRALEQATDRLRDENGKFDRASQQHVARVHRIIDEVREQFLRGIILDLIRLGAEIPPSTRAELEEGDDPPQLPAA